MIDEFIESNILIIGETSAGVEVPVLVDVDGVIQIEEE